MMLDPVSAPRMPRGKPLTPPASNMAPALRGADGGPSRCPVSPAGDGGSSLRWASPARRHHLLGSDPWGAGATPPYPQRVRLVRVVGWPPPLDASTIVDATFGGGGHSAALLAALPRTRVVAIDRDPDTATAVASLGPRLAFHQTDFRQLARVLEEEGLDDLDGAVFDLGVSSHQLDVGE